MANFRTWKWRFVIEDTGCGIKPGAKESLFTPFYQADSSSARQYGGTGLGLAISRRLAELLGGEIAVESEPDRGSIFSFTLSSPAIGREGEAVKSNAVPDALTEALRGKKILVVEDHPINLKLCLLHLRRLGCEADSAENGFQALTRIEGAAYDLILMDMQLPGLDGCDTTREIRLREADKKRTPIIAMTANAMQEDRRACLAAGMDDYLSKPVKLELLATTLAKWV